MASYIKAYIEGLSKYVLAQLSGLNASGEVEEISVTSGAAHVLSGFHAFSTVTNADVDTALELLGTFDVSNLAVFSAQFAVASQNLNAFEIHARYNSSATLYQKLYGTAGEYSLPSGRLLVTGRSDSYTNGDLTSVPAASSGFLSMNVQGVESIQLWGSCASNNGSVTIYAGGN